MLKPSLILTLPVLALLGCADPSTTSTANADDGRELFHFYSEGIAARASYRCTSGKTYPETKARAEAAHALVMAKLNPINDGRVATLDQMRLAAEEVKPGLEKTDCLADFKG